LVDEIGGCGYGVVGIHPLSLPSRGDGGTLRGA
jgi:hypothetical protein